MPIPDPESLHRLYDDPLYFQGRSDPSAAAWCNRARSILHELPFRPDSLLDFGTGEGHLVHAFRTLGIDAEGVEPSLGGRAAAARHHGLAIWEDVPASLALPFSTVTLIHSLEHVPDPLATLSELRNILMPQGAIYIEVPHANSVDMLFSAQRTTILDLPFHLHHFTPKTLRCLLGAAGYTRVRVQRFNATHVERTLQWWVHRGSGSSAIDKATDVRAGMPKIGKSAYRAVLRSTLAASRAVLAGPKLRIIARANDHIAPSPFLDAE